MRLSFALVSLALAVAACKSSEKAPPPSPTPTPTPAAPKAIPTPTPTPNMSSAPPVDPNDPLSIAPAKSPGEFVSRYAELVYRAKQSGNDFQMQRAEALAKKTPYAVDMLRGVVDSRGNFPCNGEDDYIRGCALKTLNNLDAKAALERARTIVQKAGQYCELERSAANLLAKSAPDEAADAFVARLKTDPNLERSDGLLPAMRQAAEGSPARLAKVQTATKQALSVARDSVAKVKLQDQLNALKMPPKK